MDRKKEKKRREKDNTATRLAGRETAVFKKGRKNAAAMQCAAVGLLFFTGRDSPLSKRRRKTRDERESE